MHYRSQLFVPGNRPDRFEKACQAGADLVCIDLEDAVGPGEKDAARKTVINWLSETDHQNVSLRINGLDTPFAERDIDALANSGLALPFIMIPKVGTAGELEKLDSMLPQKLGPFFAIIESAAGLVNCEAIFDHPRVSLGMYGAVDYAGDVDCDLSWDTHLYARSRLVAAAAAAEVMLFDVPHVNVRDLDECEATTRRAKALGIHARSAIHPAQVDRIHAALAPTDAELAWARSVVAADEASGGNVTLLDGKFIEAPVVKKARRIIASE